MKEVISRDAALAALKEYNHEPFHIQHALTVEGVMRWYANELGYGEDADFWATAGLLHDIDFEMWPEQQTHRGPEIRVLAIAQLIGVPAHNALHRQTVENVERLLVVRFQRRQRRLAGDTFFHG